MDGVEDIAKDIVDAAYKVHKHSVLVFSNRLTSGAMHTSFVNVAGRF